MRISEYMKNGIFVVIEESDGEEYFGVAAEGVEGKYSIFMKKGNTECLSDYDDETGEYLAEPNKKEIVALILANDFDEAEDFYFERQWSEKLNRQSHSAKGLIWCRDKGEK